MASDQHIGKGQKTLENIIVDDFVREILEKQVAFLFVNIKRDTADLLALKSFDQGLGIDQRPPAGVDDHNAGSHHCDPALTI